METLRAVLGQVGDWMAKLGWTGCIGLSALIGGWLTLKKSKRQHRNADKPGAWRNFEHAHAGNTKVAGVLWVITGAILLSWRFIPHEFIGKAAQLVISAVT